MSPLAGMMRLASAIGGLDAVGPGHGDGQHGSGLRRRTLGSHGGHGHGGGVVAAGCGVVRIAAAAAARRGDHGGYGEHEHSYLTHYC